MSGKKNGSLKNAKVTFSKPLLDFPAIYTNQAQVRSSVYDVQIIFSQLVEKVSDTEILVIPQAIVNMSPAHAKSLVKLLASQIDEYERNIAKLPD